jgi:hypothetical protein
MADDVLERFFGRGVPRLGGPAVANPRLADPVGLQLLYDEPLELEAVEVEKALRDVHPDLSAATAELYFVPPQAKPASPDGVDPAFMGLLGWDRHVVKVVGFTAPMPRPAVEVCVQPSHVGAQFKDIAYRHQAHVMLYYAGYDHDPMEQYVALAAAAGALAYFGGSFVLNETARTAVPAAVLHPHEEDGGDLLASFRKLPLPFLFCGFVKLEVEGVPGVWMRTYGCHRFGLPDLAIRARGHDVGSATFELFGNVLAYLRHSGRQFAPGDTVQVGDDAFLRLRARTEAEWYLESEGEMLVAEPIAAHEVNP